MITALTGERRTEDQTYRRLPLVGALICLAHALSHAWWTLTGPPEFVRAESVFVGGWLVVGVAAAAAVVSAGIGFGTVARFPAQLRWLWCAAGWISAAALAAYSMLLAPSLAQLVMVPFGASVGATELAELGLRAFGMSAAVLTALSTRGLLRQLRSACPECGRVHGRSPETREAATSWWGFAGGYLAVAAMVIRSVPGLIDLVTDPATLQHAPGGSWFLVFIGLMIVAGSLLPLALVHRWGRIWPSWVPFVAGRPVPRWIVLGTGIVVSLCLITYFGIGGMVSLALGTTGGVLSISGYTLWGIGLAIACVSYARLTVPPCHREHVHGNHVGVHDRF